MESRDGRIHRYDVLNSLWGRIEPAADYIAHRPSYGQILFGKGLGIGSNLINSAVAQSKTVQEPTGVDLFHARADSTPLALLNQIGVVGTLLFYLTLTAISATMASFVAVPVSEAAGWRFSLGQWAILALLTIAPLAFLLKNSKPEQKAERAAGDKAIWRSPTAVSIAFMQSVTAIIGYVSFAWLPLMLVPGYEYSALSCQVRSPSTWEVSGR